MFTKTTTELVAGRGKDPAAAHAALLDVLREAQRRLGYLPAEVFVEIEARLGIPRHTAYSVASSWVTIPPGDSRRSRR